MHLQANVYLAASGSFWHCTFGQPKIKPCQGSLCSGNETLRSSDANAHAWPDDSWLHWQPFCCHQAMAPPDERISQLSHFLGVRLLVLDCSAAISLSLLRVSGECTAHCRSARLPEQGCQSRQPQSRDLPSLLLSKLSEALSVEAALFLALLSGRWWRLPSCSARATRKKMSP